MLKIIVILRHRKYANIFNNLILKINKENS